MFGKAEYTSKCITSVKENIGIDFPYEILVVDDGSPEPFHDKSVNVIRIDSNSGFTNACNQGILWAQYRNADFVLLLNNDVEVYPNFLKLLLETIESDDNIAIASSCRYYPTADIYELYGLDLIRGYQAVTKADHLKEETIPCNWVPLCCSLVRMDVIREIGLLDKRMRTHSSDLDYCLRVKMMGYQIVVDTRSKVLHHHEITTKANNVTPEHDQQVLLSKLAGLQNAELMTKIPLDAESNTWGQLKFEVYTK